MIPVAPKYVLNKGVLKKINGIAKLFGWIAHVSALYKGVKRHL